MSKYTASGPYKVLVANMAGPSNPGLGIRPNRIRSVFEMQQARMTQGGRFASDKANPGTSTVNTLSAPTTIARSTCTVTVVDNTFTSRATLRVGPYVVVSGEDYTPGGGVNPTATALTAAINNLPGFTATVLGAVVSVSGPAGLDVPDIWATYAGSVQNFTVTAVTSGDPSFGPYSLT